MHEAHNLKLGDLQAEHDREMRVLRDELERALAMADDLNRQVSQKTMEIGCEYLIACVGELPIILLCHPDLEKEVEEGNDTVTKYVRIFGFKSFLAASFALLVVVGIF